MQRFYPESTEDAWDGWKCEDRGEISDLQAMATPQHPLQHETSHFSLARATGEPKSNNLSGHGLAWIFDSHVHASDKWDGSAANASEAW
jgi:hypothetical protein